MTGRAWVRMGLATAVIALLLTVAGCFGKPSSSTSAGTDPGAGAGNNGGTGAGGTGGTASQMR